VQAGNRLLAGFVTVGADTLVGMTGLPLFDFVLFFQKNTPELVRVLDVDYKLIEELNKVATSMAVRVLAAIPCHLRPLFSVSLAAIPCQLGRCSVSSAPLF
jgi:predicted methyltransferase